VLKLSKKKLKLDSFGTYHFQNKYRRLITNGTTKTRIRTPEMARENRKAAQLFLGKKISVYVVFTYTLLSASLGFEKSIQSYFSNEPKTAIVRVVSSGDLGKSGPGPRVEILRLKAQEAVLFQVLLDLRHKMSIAFIKKVAD